MCLLPLLQREIYLLNKTIIKILFNFVNFVSIFMKVIIAANRYSFFSFNDLHQSRFINQNVENQYDVYTLYILFCKYRKIITNSLDIKAEKVI